MSVVFTVQPVGPAPVAEYVWSSVVSFVRVRLKLKDWVLGPRSAGMSFLIVRAPVAFGSTRTTSGSSTDPDARDEPVRVMVVVPFASAGTVMSTRMLVACASPAAVLPAVSTASITNPPPWSVAFQLVGAPVRVRATRSGVGVEIETLKLTVAPGATTIAGYGVVTVKPSTASAAGAREARARVPAANAVRVRRMPGRTRPRMREEASIRIPEP